MSNLPIPQDLNGSAESGKSLFLYLCPEDYSHISEMPVSDLVEDDLSIHDFYSAVDDIVTRAHDLLKYRDVIYHSILSDIAEENHQRQLRIQQWHK